MPHPTACQAQGLVRKNRDQTMPIRAKGKGGASASPMENRARSETTHINPRDVSPRGSALTTSARTPYQRRTGLFT